MINVNVASVELLSAFDCNTSESKLKHISDGGASFSEREGENKESSKSDRVIEAISRGEEGCECDGLPVR